MILIFLIYSDSNKKVYEHSENAASLSKVEKLG